MQSLNLSKVIWSLTFHLVVMSLLLYTVDRMLLRQVLLLHHLIVVWLILHTVHIIHNHLLLRGRVHLLWIHCLLRWVLHLLQMHLLVLDALRLASFDWVALWLTEIGLTSCLPLCSSTDCDIGLARAAAQLLFRCACYAQSLPVVITMAAMMAILLVVHFGKGVVLLLEVVIWAANMLDARLWGHTRVASVVRSHRPRLIWHLWLLELSYFLLRHICAQLVLRDNTLLVDRIVDSFWITNTVRIWVPTLLLFVYILAESSLFLGR